MSKKGVFSGKIAEWAEELRSIGNIAAHDADRTFNKKQAELVLDFVGAIIENCFILEDKFNKFKEYTGRNKK